MQKYIIGALAIALGVLGVMYHRTSGELTETRANLSAAVEANRAQSEAIQRLERSIVNTDKVLAEWNTDRTTLAGIRNTTRQAIKEAMRDETFKTWASSLVPPDAWRVLGSDSNADEKGAAGSTRGAASGLPENADPGKRQ
jgi:hypothetical protein